MKTIAITGSTGFVGRNLIPYLSNSGFYTLSIDRNQLSAMRSWIDQCDAVVHLAGKAHDLKKTSNPSEYYDVNFSLTKEIYEVFLMSEAKIFIFVSSVKASADVVQNVLKEGDMANPQTHYGKSKLMAEEYIRSQVLPEGKSYYILRPCMIHGPGNKGNLNLLYQFIKKGIPYPLAAFTNKRSFLSVENLCFVISELLKKKGVSQGVYNVCDDEQLSTNEVVSIFAASLGKKEYLWAIPQPIVRFIARLGDRLYLPLNTERLNKMTENYLADNHKIKEVLEKPLPISARRGLEITASSFKNSNIL